MDNIVLFDDGEIELKVSIEKETVWLNRQQLSELFDRDVKTIGKHINNVFKEKELDKSTTVANFATVQIEGGRKGNRKIARNFIVSQNAIPFHRGALKILGRLG